jgi:nucleotide-binding universal stress UspA family protein
VSAYRTVVVGTDGSESSLRAVARAGALDGAVAPGW